MKLVGLGKEPLSDELTFSRSDTSASVLVKPKVLPNVFKSTFHTGTTSLLLQVNVTLPFSGTTYPPGVFVGTASPDRARVTEKGQICIYTNVQLCKLTQSLSVSKT